MERNTAILYQTQTFLIYLF